MGSRCASVATFAAILVASTCSNKARVDEVLKKSDASVSARAYVSWTKPSTRVGQGLIDQPAFTLDISRDGAPLDVPRAPNTPPGWCAPEDKARYQLFVDGARGVVAQRCAPADA